MKQLFHILSLRTHHDMYRRPRNSRHMRHAQRGPQRIVIFGGMPHDQDIVRLPDQLAQRLRHYPCTHACIFLNRLALAAESLGIVMQPHDRLVAAAPECHVQTQPCLFRLIAKRPLMICTTDTERHRNPVNGMDTAYLVKNIEVGLHQRIERSPTDTGDITVPAVTFDEPVKRANSSNTRVLTSDHNAERCTSVNSDVISFKLSI